jgi:Uma2 family endonuclease
MYMPATRIWTLEELHSLPDDGNKHELVRGELFVTPAPSPGHEYVAARITRCLETFVVANNLGYIYHPRAVIRFKGSEVEPDLMVRRQIDPGTDWEAAPVPILVVEILSPTTRRRDHVQKRHLYLDAGVAEYWIVDAEARSVTVVRLDAPDVVTAGELQWFPATAAAALVLDVRRFFGES